MSKPWEEYKNSSGGPWEEYKPKEFGAAGVARNIAQGASLNFSDELAGGVEAVGQAIGVKGAGGPMKNIGLSDEGPTLDWSTLRDAYLRARDLERKTLKHDKENNPTASTLSQIAGGLVSPVNKLKALQSLSGVKSGAALGGVSGLGASEGDNIVDITKDTGLGIGLGAGVGYIADKASPYLQKGIEKLQRGSNNSAERLSAKAIGAERGTIKKLGEEETREIGRYGLDNKLFGAFSDTDDMIARNLANKARGGQMMDDVYSQIDDAGVSTFNPLEAAAKVDDEIGGFYRSPINRGETNQLENTLESITLRGDKNIPIKEAQALKEELGKVANWKNNINITDKEKMARDAYSIVSSQIDDAVESGAQAIGSDGLLNTLKQGKKLFSNSKGAEALLENKLAREQGNKLLGLTDWSLLGGGGAATLATGGSAALPTAGALGVKKYAEKYGAQQSALILDKVSKYLLKSPQMAEIYQKNPALFQSMAEKMAIKFESMFSNPRMAEKPEQPPSSQYKAPDKNNLILKTQNSKYGQVLKNAASRGDDAFSAAHFVLSQRDPEYRKHLDSSKFDSEV